MHYFVGVDLGKSQDYTAICIVEQIPTGEDDSRGRPINKYHVRHLERLPLGMPYPAQIDSVLALGERLAAEVEREERPAAPGIRVFENARDLAEAQEAARPKAFLIVDGTGVGAPVCDSMRAVGLRPIAVTITAGQSLNAGPGGWNVPKFDLVATVQMLLGSKRLKFAPELPGVDLLTGELLAYQVSVTPGLNASYDARQGAHDDLVLALAIACWYAERIGPPRPVRSYDGFTGEEV